MAPDGHLVAGRYRLLRTLAAGGMGRVWLATDELLDRQVAIKKCVLPAGLSSAQQDLVRGLTLREARAFARVDHPNVIRILDVLPDEEEPWIVMEYVASRSLAQLIQQSGALPPGRAAAIGLAVLNGLGAVERAGVLHLDVKPGNVLIGDEGRIVLADFGPAVTDEAVRALAGAGIVLGSPKYIAPERLAGGDSTAQADLWSLGATLYHAVEGRPPYVRDTVEETLRALADGAPDPPRHAGPLAGVLTGLLRHDPAERLGPAEVADRLRAVADQPGPPPPVASRRRPRLVSRLAVPAAVLAVVAAIGGVGAATRLGDPAGEPGGGRPALAASPAPRIPFVLPEGFRWWNDPEGFRVAVPGGWRRSRDPVGALLFEGAAGGPSLRISQWDVPPRNVVAALVTEETRVRSAGYRRLRIEALAEPPQAVWEYTFRDPRGTLMHGLHRVMAVDGRIYLIAWQVKGAAWAAELQKLAVVQDSFGPAPGS